MVGLGFRNIVGIRVRQCTSRVCENCQRSRICDGCTGRDSQLPRWPICRGVGVGVGRSRWPGCFCRHSLRSRLSSRHPVCPTDRKRVCHRSEHFWRRRLWCGRLTSMLRASSAAVAQYLTQPRSGLTTSKPWSTATPTRRLSMAGAMATLSAYPWNTRLSVFQDRQVNSDARGEQFRWSTDVGPATGHPLRIEVGWESILPPAEVAP